MLPSWVTFVELPDASELVAATLFVCASAVPPQESATDEITEKYNLRLRFFLSFSLNSFIKFNGLKFSNTLPRIFQDSHFEKHHTVQRKDLVYMGMVSDGWNRTVRNQRIKKRQEGLADLGQVKDFYRPE
jgi:hypothetical protein